jgi:hypothetical protein
MAVLWCTHFFAAVSLTIEAWTFLTLGPARVFPLCWARTLPHQLGSSHLARHRLVKTGYSSNATVSTTALCVTARDLGCVREEASPADPRPWSAPRPRRSRGVAALRLGPWVRQSSAPHSMHISYYAPWTVLVGSVRGRTIRRLPHTSVHL